MSKQRRSFFALRGAAPDHVQMPPIPNFSLCGGNAFTIECTFFTEHKEDESVFIQQDDVFSAGMTNGTVYFEAKHLGRIQTVAQQTPIEEGDWTYFTVVYDGSKLSLYLQGFVAIEKTVGAGARLVEDKTRFQLAILEGYLQNVAIYSKALTAEEVRKNQFTPQTIAENTELAVDFNAFLPGDEGRHKLPIQLIGACETVNLVASMLCDKDAGTIPIGVSPVNPGGQGLASYTILAKVYPKYRVIAGEVYLFANGELGQADTIALGLSDGQRKPFFQAGGQRFAFSGTIVPNLWVDIAVTVTGQTVTLYLDGVASGVGTFSAPFVRQGQPALTFGNIMSHNRFANGFTGFLDSVAIFSAALPANRILGYADIAPYAFDTDLAALWAFYENEVSELLSGGIVSMTGGAEVALRENTLLDRTAPELAFAIPDTKTGLNDLQTWETDTVAKAFALCVEEMTGMEAGGCFTPQGNLYGSLASTLYYEHKDNKTMGIIETSEKATSANMGDILKYAAGGAALGLIIYGLYGMFSSRSNRIKFFLRRFRRWIINNIPDIFFTTAFSASAGAMTSYIIVNTPPDTEKAETDEYDISLVSLSFYNNESTEAGALCARPDFAHPPVVPEWVHNVTPPAPALYYRNISTGKTPKLRAVFTVTLKKSASVTITVGAKGLDGGSNTLVLGELAAKTITAAASGNYTVDFPLTSNTLRQAALGKQQISWGWYYQSKAQHVLKTTEHQIHIIYNKPLSPWTTETDSACLPVYSLLNHCAQIAARTEAETDANKRFASQLVDWSHSAGRFTARGLNDNAQYARWDKYHRKLTVDLEKFTVELGKTTAVPVTFMDITCLQLLLTRLEGLADLCLFEMKTILGGPLHTRKGKGLGAVALASAFIPAYYACGICDAAKKATVWDAFATLKAPDGTDFTAKGTPFSEYPRREDMIGLPDKTRYRTLLCSAGTTCRIAMSTQRLFIGALPLQFIVPTWNRKHLLAKEGRPSFAEEIKSQLVLAPFDMRCHSISYSYMQQCIVYLINAYLDAPDDDHYAACMSGIELLIRAVTLTVGPDDPNMDGLDYNAWAALKGGDESQGLEDLLAEKASQMQVKADSADILLNALNNNVKNLRLGKSDWNSSLQENYDCREWIYVYEGDDGNLYFGSRSTNPLFHTPVSDIDGFSFEEPGFYLLNKVYDGDRLCTLAELPMGEWQFPLPEFKVGALIDTVTPELNASDTRRLILFSSSNTWDLETYKTDFLGEGEAPVIHIKSDDTWVELPIL